MNSDSKRVKKWKEKRILCRKVVEFNKDEENLVNHIEAQRKPFAKYAKELIRKDMKEDE